MVAHDAHGLAGRGAHGGQAEALGEAGRGCPSGVSPGWMMRAVMPSAQAEAETRKASDFGLVVRRNRPGRACPRSAGRRSRRPARAAAPRRAPSARAPPSSRASTRAASPRCRRGRPCGADRLDRARSRARRSAPCCRLAARRAPRAAGARSPRRPRHRAGGRRERWARAAAMVTDSEGRPDDLKHRATSFDQWNFRRRAVYFAACCAR